MERIGGEKSRGGEGVALAETEGKSAVTGRVQEKHFPESSWRERKREKHLKGTEQEICSPKSLTERKERVSIPPGFLTLLTLEHRV